jgi:hypothetical protein
MDSEHSTSVERDVFVNYNKHLFSSYHYLPAVAIVFFSSTRQQIVNIEPRLITIIFVNYDIGLVCVLFGFYTPT